MRLTTAPDVGGDRHSDQRTTIIDLSKPAVLRRSTLRWWCAACLLTIVYGTLGPIAGGTRPWLASPAAWRWIPPLQPTDANDVLTNLAVYVPVGIASRLLVRRRGRAGRRDLLLAFGLSATLSYATEVMQQAIPARSSNLADVLVNALGALAGCLAAVPAQRAIRRVHALAFVHVQAPGRARGATVALAGVLVATVGYGGVVAVRHTAHLWAGQARSGQPGAKAAQPLVQWTPLERHFRASFRRAVDDIMGKVALYGQVSLLCLLLTRGRASIVALLAVLGPACAGEFSRAAIAGRAADITTPLLAAVAWLLAVRMWRSIYPQPGAPEPRPSGRAA